ncbi:HupE/UreJ family protein [Acanthopleuribacter pedis]|uniref:HupE/UreJ family protein n=1 Tax=Acanthopleuribacter pedis TaxID=442870 RepID=A0A8J7QII3_9BACT|nr:HupE/UreJ family protein [Acanthopleuribacter pedis]MBO1320960.1 HupE/UreJ family protein [Acanthopleuribacter pedis]
MKPIAALLIWAACSGLFLFGHGGHAEDHFTTGLLHPFSGWDHLAACALVGLLAGRLKNIWPAPLMFAGGLAAGLALTLLLPGLPLTGALVVLSLLILFSLPALDVRDLSTWLSCCLVMIGAAHGYGHAAATGPQPGFLLGMFCTSLLLIGAFAAMIKAAKHAGRSLRFQYIATAAGVLFLQVTLYAWS